MKRFLEEAKRIIQMNSVSSHGNEEIANYLATLMQERDLKTQLQLVTHSYEELSKRQFNVIGILGDPLSDRKIRKGLLLCSHLDTADPGILSYWTQTYGNPFLATLKDGGLYGLGAGGPKLDFLCKLHALDRLREKKFKQPVYLLGTCGGECGMFGARYFIKSLSLNPQWVVVSEPSDFKVIYEHKYSMIYRVSLGYPWVERDAHGFNRKVELRCFGRSSHSCNPQLGRNAIWETLQFLSQAMEHGFEMRFTGLEGGGVNNQVPDHCMVEFYLNSHQLEDFKYFFRETMPHEDTFRMELSGVRDAGVRFFPEDLFGCILEVVQFFQRLEFSLKDQKDPLYDPAFSTVNLAKIQKKSSLLEMYFDLRLLPEIAPEVMDQQIRKAIQPIAAQYPRLNITVNRDQISPTLKMPLGDPWLQNLEKVIDVPDVFAKKSNATEAALFFQAGYPAVAFGPGKSQGNSHASNESICLEHLEKAISFYESLIESVCC